MIGRQLPTMQLAAKDWAEGPTPAMEQYVAKFTIRSEQERSQTDVCNKPVAILIFVKASPKDQDSPTHARDPRQLDVRGST